MNQTIRDEVENIVGGLFYSHEKERKKLVISSILTAFKGCVPEKKEHKLGCENRRGGVENPCDCGAGEYNQAIDDIHKIIDASTTT